MIDALIELWKLGYERVCIEFMRDNWGFCEDVYGKLWEQWKLGEHDPYTYMGSETSSLAIELQNDFARLVKVIFIKYPFPDDLKAPVGEHPKDENRAIYFERILKGATK